MQQPGANNIIMTIQSGLTRRSSRVIGSLGITASTRQEFLWENSTAKTSEASLTTGATMIFLTVTETMALIIQKNSVINYSQILLMDKSSCSVMVQRELRRTSPTATSTMQGQLKSLSTPIRLRQKRFSTATMKFSSRIKQSAI